MHSVRSLLLVASAILGFAFLASSASQAAGFTPFTVKKTCSGPANPAFPFPTVCTISTSSVGALNGGAKIFYYGPQINPTFVSSTVVLEAVDGSTASGYCNVFRAASPIEGICAFHAGSGALAGFQAVAKVTVDLTTTPATWSWIGTETHGP